MGIETFKVQELMDRGWLYVGDGYRAKNSELSSKGLPFARAGNIDSGFHFDGADCIPQTDVAKVGNKVSSVGDVVFTSKGTVGRFAFVRKGTPTFVYSPQLCFWRSLNHEKIRPRFLFYWMSSREFFLQYNSVKGQTDMADYVSLTDQRRMFVGLPPVAIQDQIVASLDPIDEKIELNRKMNETLEQMARAIFRSWFIDFDPVHAKAAGKFPFGMDSETASLFPDCFEKSELGDVPTNWKVCSLGEIATVKHGYAFQGEFFSEEPTDMVLMTPGNFAVGGGFKADKFKFYRGPVADEYILAEGDLVVTMTDLSKAGDTLGYGAFIGPLERGRKALHNQRVGKVIALGSQGNLQYLYQVFCSPAYRHHVLGSATGSTVRHTSPSRILEHKIALAPEQLRLHFSKLVEPLFLLQRSLVRENLSLVETRDLFLPRLLSGDVALKDVS